MTEQYDTPRVPFAEHQIGVRPGPRALPQARVEAPASGLRAGGAGTTVYSSRVTEARSRIQIFRHDGRDKIFEVNDALSFQPGDSKLQFVILEYARGGGAGSGGKQVRHWMDVPVAKALCTAVLEGRIEQLGARPLKAADVAPGAPTVELYSEMKGTNGESRILKIRLVPGNDRPYTIAIVNGPGEAVGNGIVKPVKSMPVQGDRHQQERVDLMVSFTRLEFYVMARELLDYVQQWETINFRKRQQARMITRLPASEPTPARSSPPLPKREGNEFRVAA
jgi:hypothetical protein